MYMREKRVLLRHYLEQGVAKAELARRPRVSRRTIYNWIETGQLDRDRRGAGTVSSAPAGPDQARSLQRHHHGSAGRVPRADGPAAVFLGRKGLGAQSAMSMPRSSFRRSHVERKHA